MLSHRRLRVGQLLSVVACMGALLQVYEKKVSAVSGYNLDVPRSVGCLQHSSSSTKRMWQQAPVLH